MVVNIPVVDVDASMYGERVKFFLGIMVLCLYRYRWEWDLDAYVPGGTGENKARCT